MKTILKLILLGSILTLTTAAACGDPDEKKDDIIIIDNNGTPSPTNNTTTPGENNKNNVSPTNNKVNNAKKDYPFTNDPKKALDAIEILSYKCFADGDESAIRLRFFERGALSADDFKGGESVGSWEKIGEKIKVSIPEFGFSETTTAIAIDLDIVATMVFPSFVCGALGVNNEAETTKEVLFCDNHEFISEVLIEDSEFQFWNTGYVKRRRWEELLSVPDTLYSEIDGIWKESGGVIYVVFPRGTGEDADSIRYLTMVPKGEGFLVKEFGNPSGTQPCAWK